MADGLFGTSQRAPALQQTKLNPAGVSQVQSLRPVVRESGGNLNSLANALGSLNSALNNYASVQHRVGEDPNSEMNQREIAKMQQMSLDELMAQEDIELRSRPQRDAFRVLLGERAYADAVPALEAFFQTEFDRTGDAGAAYDAKLAEFAERLPDEIAQGRFYELMQPHRQRIIGGLAQEQIDYAKQEVGTTLVSSWHTQIAERRRGGEAINPTALAEEIFSASAASEKFLLMSPQEQQQTLWNLAQRLALDGDVDAAEAILSTPRKGANGETLPALREIAEFSTKAVSLIETGKAQRHRQAVEGNAAELASIYESVNNGTFTVEGGQSLIERGLFTDEQVGRMAAQAANTRATANTRAERERAAVMAEHRVIAAAATLIDRPGGVHRITDQEVPTASGGTRKLTRNEIIGTITARQEEVFAAEQERLVAAGTDPADAERIVGNIRQGWYVDRGIKNEEWERAFEALPSTVTPIALENPAVMQNAVATAENYLNLRAKSAAYADGLTDEGSRDFLERYAIAREVQQLPPEDAMRVAAAVEQTPYVQRAGTLKPDERERLVRTAIREVGGTRGLVAENIVDEQIDRLISVGVTSPRAIERNINQWLEERTVLVNGTPIPVTSEMRGNFPILAERHLARVFEEKKEVFDFDSVEDIALVPGHSENYWVVVDARTNQPIGSMNLTNQGLAELYDEWKAEEEEIAANLRSERMAEAEADAAARRQAFEDRVNWYEQRIGQWRNMGKIGQWVADDLEEDLARFRENSNPEIVAQREADRAATERLAIRQNSVRLGFPDPFPEDGPLPEEDDPLNPR